MTPAPVFYALARPTGQFLAFNRDLGDFWTPGLTPAVLPFPTYEAADEARRSFGLHLEIVPFSLVRQPKTQPQTQSKPMLLNNPFRVFYQLDKLNAEIYRDEAPERSTHDGVTVHVQPLTYVATVNASRPSTVQTLIHALALDEAGLAMGVAHASTLAAFRRWRGQPHIGPSCVWNPAID